MNKNSGFYKNGKSHAEGGIPVLVDGSSPIEVEQFEYKICNNAMNSTKTFEFKNKTNKEILDDIFQYANCEFEQNKANSGDFIICKLAVMDKSKRNITGTAKEIINVMQSEKSCNVTNDSKFKDGGEINDETYTKWKNLVNMSKSELENFYNSKDGKEAGLSSSEASEQGISSGRESARWIMKMKDTPKSEWTPTMWKWANKQISFISRMSGMKGDLYDDKGNKTRKHTSLLIWGHNPKKYKDGGVLEKRNLTYIGEVGSSNVDEFKKIDWGKNEFDEKQRFEISDENLEIIDFDKLYTQSKNNKGDKFVLKLSEIIKHDILFEAYPDLKNIDFEYTYNESSNSFASYNFISNNIKYNFYGEDEFIKSMENALRENGKNLSTNEQLSRRRFALRRRVLLHELQHYVQYYENHGQGSSWVREYRRILQERGIDERTIGTNERNILIEEAQKLNRSYLGEMESKDAEYRINLSFEERKNKKPFELLPYKVESVLVKLKDIKELKDGGELNTNEDCAKYIKENGNVFKNGYYSFVKNMSIYADSYGGKIPKIDSLIIISYNSGGQNNLKVTDTINSSILQKQIGELIEEENGIPKIIISKHLLNAKRVNEDIFNLIKNNNVVIIDRDEVVCSNLTNNKILKNGGELNTNEIENKLPKNNVTLYTKKVGQKTYKVTDLRGNQLDKLADAPLIKPEKALEFIEMTKNATKEKPDTFFRVIEFGTNKVWYDSELDKNKTNEMENKENKTHTYALTLRPFYIGTYPKENFIRFVEEEEDNYKFGLLEYSKELPIETIKHYSLAPVSDLMKYDGKEFTYYEDLKAKAQIVKNNSNIPYVKVTMFDENNEVIDETEISGQNFLENVNKGDYKLVDDSDLAKGIEVESEHKETAEKLYNQEITPEQAAESIAKEHLAESPDYYKELDKMEEKLKNKKMEINTNIVTNWDEVPKVWRNIEKVKKVNFVNSPYNKDLIKLITPFTGDDALRPTMSGIHFDENGITATDAHKLINLPYPNKDFNGTYATVPKKFLKDEKSIKNDLFSDKYPNYKVIIPTSDKAERVQEISVYKLLQYTEVAVHYANQSSKYLQQVAFSLGDIRYGLNGEFLIEVLKTALKLGHEKLYAFTTLANRAIVFSDNKNYELGKDLIFLIMPVMLLDDYDHKGKKYERPLGAQDLDWGREITVYYDFSKDAIVNQDGSIAEFKMNYGEYDVLPPNEISVLKNFQGKNNTIPVLDYFKVQGNKVLASNLETFITIKNTNLKDGLYQIRDNAVEFDPTYTLSSYEEYPNPRDRSEKRIEFSINSDVLLHYVKIALEYNSDDELRPVMTGILFDYNQGKMYIVSTDAHKLLKINITEFIEIDKDQKDFQFILSENNLLKFLDNVDDSKITISSTKELAIFENDEFIFESRLIDGKYPAYNQVISAFKNKKLTINIKDLFNCIKSKEAETFIKSNKGEDILIYDKLKSESELSINLGFLESEYSKDRKIAKSIEICKVDYKLENGDYQTKDSLVLLMPIMGDNENFIFKYKFFKTALETLNCENVELFYDEKNRAYVFGGDCFGYESTIKAKKKEVAKKSIEPKTEIKEQSSEQKEFKEAINTFEELIKLGGTDAEIKEFQEAIETFKMLLDEEPTKYAKGGELQEYKMEQGGKINFKPITIPL